MNILLASSSQKVNFEETILNSEYLNQVPKTDYILGPGDIIFIDFSPQYIELSQKSTIDGEGTINLPFLDKVFVSGLTTNELKKILSDAFESYIKFPSIDIEVVKYRPLRVFVAGEVENPGLHNLKGSFSVNSTKGIDIVDTTYYFPTVFDAIQRSGGITEYSDLSNIEVIRKENLTNGGGKIITSINFENLLINGDKSQNIRIYDSDIIRIPKSNKSNKEILKRASLSDLNPKYIEVFISGRIQTKQGIRKLGRTTYLVDAIDLAIPRTLRGKVFFMRLNKDGTVDRRRVAYNRSAKRGSYNNPLLKNGDILTVGSSLVNHFNEAVTEITTPFIGIFSAYSFYNTVTD